MNMRKLSCMIRSEFSQLIIMLDEDARMAWKSAGGGYCNHGDNLRLMKLYADGGVWDNEKGFSGNYVNEPSFRMECERRQKEIHRKPEITFMAVMAIESGCTNPKRIYRADIFDRTDKLFIPDLNMLIAITENHI